MINATIKKHFQEHISIVDALLQTEGNALDASASEIAASFLGGGKLYLFGSCVSAMTAHYAATLFINNCRMPRPPLPAISLRNIYAHSKQTDNNDVYEKQISALASPPDIVWGITTDSADDAVIRGLRTAAHNKIKTISMCGKENNALQGVSDIVISVNSSDPLRILELHTLVISAIADRIDEIMFNPNKETSKPKGETRETDY